MRAARPNEPKRVRPDAEARSTARRFAARPAGDRADAVRRALGWGARAAVVALAMVSGAALDLPFGVAADLLAGFALGLALLGLGSLIVSALRWVAVDLRRVLGDGVLLATAGALVFLVVFNPVPPLAAVLVWLVWLVAFAALVIGFSLSVTRARTTPLPTWLRVALPVAGVSVFAAAATWWWHPGRPDASMSVAAGAVTPALVDPGAPGPLAVASFTYGSGAPRWRDAYGADAALATTSVDLADLVEVGGLVTTLRRAVLGHGFDAVPRNGTVWHPVASEGPHPLVLVVHGNANLFTPSELGYEWLGRHLASRGYVVVSIDASAFNALPLVGGLQGENDARALLLLSHLELWRAWQGEGHGVAATVDLERIALVGHSRGGESAAIAAALDRIGRLPADATRALHERVGGPYGVRAVVAFAPSDGQFRVGDRPTMLDGVDYLVLQGGYDADVTSFVGERQYERTVLADGGFKAAVYLHEANHGQFNTRWGRSDLQPPLDAVLRTAPIMPGSDQRRATAALVTAHLERSLRGDTRYAALFHDADAQAAWLPSATPVVRYDDGAGVGVARFDEDVDPTTASLPGSTARGEALAIWREGAPRYRGTQARDANALTLGWQQSDAAPAYRVAWPTDLGLDLGRASSVRIDIARGTRPFPDGSAAPLGPLDAHVVLADASGRRAAVPLSAGGGVPPDLPSAIARFGVLALPRFTPQRFPLFATVELPLAAFLEATPDLDLAALRALDFEFDLVATGIVVVRAVELVPAPATVP